MTPIITDKNIPKSSNSSTQTLASDLKISASTKYYYKLEITLNYLESIDQTSDLNAILSTHFIIEEEHEDNWTVPELVSAIMKNNDPPVGSIKEEKLNFGKISITEDTREGLYSMEDDYGISYYFRGAANNNYVKFGNYYWRIIRINGNGSLRIQYDGTRAHVNGESDIDRLALTNVAWNLSNKNDTKYLGYMYGGENGTASSKRVDLGQSEYDDSLNSIYNQTESNIKIELESWYKTNILDKGLDIFVSDEIFCNDRSTPGKEISNWSYDTGLGYGPKQTAYGARARLIDGKTTNSKGDTTNPQFICPNKNDAFTKADIKVGNGKLNQKVGLITADEINTAGGISSVDNNSYYLYKGSAYWSSSPMNYYSSNASMMYVTASGSIHFLYVNKTSGVAPVINLTPEYVLQMVGDGTIGNEYRVE